MYQTALDLTVAQARADRGVALSARRAEKTSPGWIEAAANAVGAFARRVYPDSFTIERARAAVADQLESPTDLRAWCAVTRQCAARGLIARLPGEFAPTASSNGAPKALYRAGGCV